MVYRMKLKNDPFRKIQFREKTVELRLYDYKRRRLDSGDEIIFTNLDNDCEELAVRVKALYRYGSFEELFSEIPPEQCGFRKKETIEEAASEMLKYYSNEQISIFGVLGIRIELVSLEDTIKHLEAIREAEFDHWFPDGMK